MNIVCPQCGFTRDVPEDRLPSAATIATCPQCRHRFKVSRPSVSDMADGAAANAAPDTAADIADTSRVEPEQRYTSSPGVDDPLPPGAVIPGQTPDPDMERAHAHDQKSDAAPVRTDRTARQGQEQRKSTAWQDEEEYRQAALAAYQQQSTQADEPLMENPWENPGKEGYLAAFYQTIVRVMFAAPRFFAGLKADTPQHKALIFYLLVSVCQILIERIWGDILSSTLAPSANGDPQLQNLLQMLTPQTNILMAVLMRSAMVTLELFVAAGLYFLIFKLLVPTRANYQLIFQVLAYSAAPALLCVVPVAGSVAGFIWGIACSFVGCRHALGLSWGQTAMGLIPIYAMAIPVLMYVFQAVRTMTG